MSATNRKGIEVFGLSGNALLTREVEDPDICKDQTTSAKVVVPKVIKVVSYDPLRWNDRAQIRAVQG